MAKKSRKDLEPLLESWQNLVDGIMTLPKRDVETLLDMEREREEPRAQFLTRIHQRLTKLRSLEERDEILREAKK